MLFNSDVELPLTSSLCDCDHNSRNFALAREFVYILEWKKKKKVNEIVDNIKSCFSRRKKRFEKDSIWQTI